MATKLPIRNYARSVGILELPKLIDVQLDSFEQFTAESLTELFEEISPIESYNGDMKLYFPCNRPEVQGFDLKYWFGEPKYDVDECVERDMSYAAPLTVRVLLYRSDLDQPIVQEIFMGDFPLMTEAGTFIINGTERVVVSQLIRSPALISRRMLKKARGGRWQWPNSSPTVGHGWSSRPAKPTT